MDIQRYLDAVKLKLAVSPIVSEAEIVQEQSQEDRGFFRARLRLANTDFVEVAEYFIMVDDQVRTAEYRYQWMDSSQQLLRKRLDNAAHYPELANAPHHVHVGNENKVEPGMPLGVIEFIDMLTLELAGNE